MGDMLRPALAYASVGWDIFPLSARKAPAFPSAHQEGDPQRGTCKGECGRVGHGFYDATSDPAMIRAWWTAHPHRNIGGRVPADRIVLDIDPHGGGEDTLARLQRDHGPLPATLTCRSGRGDGGRHLYYMRPPGALSGSGLRPGIDLVHHCLRYVVLPPSIHPATRKPYVWTDPYAPVAELPMWAVTLLQPKPPASPATPGFDWSRFATGDCRGLVRFIANHDASESSGRHDAVLWALCRAHEREASPVAIEAICRAAEGIGKSRNEIDSLAEWAAGYYGRAAR